MPETLCLAQELSFSYPAGSLAVRSLDLEIYREEIFGLVGPSGSGKSTLLKLLAGILAPSEGKVLFEGKPIDLGDRESRRYLAKRRGMTFQMGALFDSWTCGENIEFSLRELSSLKAVTRRQKVIKALDKVGLRGVENLAVSELSGGMQKRLALARALVLEPICLFLDDPTAGLDPITARKILDLIKGLNKEDEMTIVVVSSEVRRIAAFSDRVAYMESGSIAAVGTLSELQKETHDGLKRFLKGVV